MLLQFLLAFCADSGDFLLFFFAHFWHMRMRLTLNLADVVRSNVKKWPISSQLIAIHVTATKAVYSVWREIQRMCVVELGTAFRVVVVRESAAPHTGIAWLNVSCSMFCVQQKYNEYSNPFDRFNQILEYFLTHGTQAIEANNFFRRIFCVIFAIWIQLNSKLKTCFLVELRE